MSTWRDVLKDIDNRNAGVADAPGSGGGSGAGYQEGWRGTFQKVTERYRNLDYDGMNARNTVINRFLNDSRDFFSAAQNGVYGGEGFDAEAYFAERQKQADYLRSRAATISGYVEMDKDFYDTQNYNSMVKYLSDFDTNVDDAITLFQYWSDPANQQYESRKNMDIGLEQRKADHAQQMLDNWYWNADYDATSAEERQAFDAELARRQKAVSDQRQEINLARQVQKNAGMVSVVGNDDYAEKSGYVSREGDIPSLYGGYRSSYNDPGVPSAAVYEYINGNETVRQNLTEEQKALLAGKGYDQLNPEEIGIYNYYYATQGENAAQQYLDNIQENLNQRKAENLTAPIQGEPWKELMLGAVAGINHPMDNLANLFSGEDYIPPSVYQYTTEKIGEDLGNVNPNLWYNTKTQQWENTINGRTLGQIGLDVVTTGANMIPAMLASAAVGAAAPVVAPGLTAALGGGAAIGKVAGGLAMGASAAGGAYQEALNSGYSKEQARAYSALIGASEAGMEYLLGGISKLGGVVPEAVMGKIVDGIDNALARAAVEMGGSMLSEGFEEGLQEVITPWIKNLTLMADENVNWNDVAYSTLLGALSVIPMEGPGVTRNAFSRRGTGADAPGRAMAVGDVKVSQTGAAVHIPTQTEVSPLDFDSVEKGKATVLMKDSSTAAYEEVAFDSELQGNQFYAAASLPGIETEAANKVLHTIQEADVGHNADEVVAIREAYGMGYINAARRELATNPELRPLNQQLRETLYDIGQQQRAEEKLGNPTPAPEITPAEGYKRVVFEGKVSTGNKAVEAQVKFVDFIAENIAKTIVHVYESYSRGGKRYYRDSQGVEHQAPNGKYYKGEIWLDTKSGDKGEGLMLNTFAHEMYHHLKANNAAGAGKLEKFISSELGIQNVNAAIDRQIRKARAAGWGETHFRAEGMTEIQAANEVYQRAVEDFYADALETVFTRGDPQKAIARLKKEDRGLFDQIKDFIDQWVSKLKKFYSDKTISIEGEMVARLKNFEQLQQMFMEEMQKAGGSAPSTPALTERDIQSKVAQDNEVQFSNRYLNQITENDKRYLDAIKRGDMETAHRMVEEAAKNAGYDSPKLYHGTNSFGFTKFDLKKLYDRISIFATSNSHVAETYSGETARRKISEKATITPEALENASPEELLKLLQENISKEYRIVSDAERSQIIEANRKPLIEAARSVENLYVINIDMFNEEKKTALFAVSGKLREMAKAETYSEIMSKKMDYDDALWDLRWMDDSLTDEVISAIGNKENLAFRELTKWLDQTMFYADSEYSKANGTPWMNSVEAVNELYPRLFKGVYEFYGRTGNAFEIMADGANWNQLDGSKIGQYGPVRTRDVSRYAYDSGYDSVIFRDIRDNADYTYSGNSDVYVFFGSNMLKSADTVTYDDDGNIIPISQRFNPEKEDIRYSIRNTPESVHDVRRRLADAFDVVAAGSRLQSVKDKAEEYRGKIAEAERLESDLGIVRDQIREMRESRGSKGKVKELTKQTLTLQRQMDAVNRRILYIEGLKPFREAAQADRQAYAKAQQITRQEEQRQAITQRNLENRVLREEMTGRDSDITIMEKEFVRLAKQYEAKNIDLKTMEKEFLRLAKEYDLGQKQYNDLMRRYEASGRKIARLEQTILRQRETAKERAVSRRKAELQRTIQRTAKSLDQMLRFGTKTKNVPQRLQKSVSAILEAINMEVQTIENRAESYEKTMQRYSRKIAMASTQEEVDRLIAARDRYAKKSVQFETSVAEMKKAYEEIQKDPDPTMTVDEGLQAHLMTLFALVGDTPLGQMTVEQMNAVKDVLNITMATVQNANKAVAAERKETISQMGKDAMREVQSTGGQGRKGKDITKTRAALEKFGWNNMRPIDAMEAIGSRMLLGLYKGMRKGEDIWARDTAEARKFFLEQWNKHGGKNWDMEEKRSFEAASGDTFQLNLEQRMSIYAHFRREQSREHLRKGGFVFDPGAGKKITQDATAYNLTDETIGEIIGSLTGAQMAFVEQMQTYLSKTMGAKGNEVSLRMYGIKLFKEENYFPLRISDRYRETPTEQGPGRKMKNAGFTRAVTPNANNAIVLAPFLTVWGSHVDEMANYHAFVLPVEDFTRVYNYKEGVSSEESGSMSVKAAIQNAYGAAAADYVQRMLEDINGGVKGDKTTGVINKAIALQKKGATMASLSVVIQQPSSILRAMSMINPRYFIGPKMTERTQGRTWEEIKRYAPIAIIKEMGRFDVNMGKNAVEYLTGREYDTWSEKAKALAADSSYRDDVLGRWPALADEIGWSAIWNAVKRETRELHPDMDIHSQRFMDTVAERFTEIITHTQVYDSVFSRSANMRSRDTGMKMVTAFMAEPTVAINMMARAVVDWKRTGNRKAAITTLSAVAAAQILNSALAAVVYAMRDDDEDETYGEKYISALTSGLLNSVSLLSYVPLLRDVQSILQGYDVERMDMSLIADFGDACKGLWDEETSLEEKITRFFAVGFQVTGVPVKNIIRDMAALKNTVETLARTERGTATGRSIAVRENLPFAGRYDDGEQMLLAIRKGDMAHLERVAARFENQQQAESALRTAIGNAYKNGDLTEDDVTEMLSTYTDMEGNDIYWKMDEWNYVRDTGDTDGYLKTGALQAAIESGEGIEEEIQRYKDHGMDDGDIRSNITRIYKKQYLEAAEEGREQIVAKVTPAYRAAGMDETDIAGTINGWDFEAKYGMSYGEFKGEYRDGLVTERDMRQAMMDYGLRNFEIEEDIRDLNEDIDFMGRFGMSLTDMKAGYDDGDVPRNNLISALEYTGMSHEDAVEEVSRRDISNRLGIDYMKLDDAYKWDDISRQTFYNAMVENGATREEADEAITGYDWLKKHRATHPELTISVAKKFTTRIHSDYAPDETLEDYGVSVDAYLEYAERRPQCKGIDADGDGYADSGTLRDDIFRMIDSLPISDRAKTGLALQSYSLKSIKKNAPWY